MAKSLRPKKFCWFHLHQFAPFDISLYCRIPGDLINKHDHKIKIEEITHYLFVKRIIKATDMTAMSSHHFPQLSHKHACLIVDHSYILLFCHLVKHVLDWTANRRRCFFALHSPLGSPANQKIHISTKTSEVEEFGKPWALPHPGIVIIGILEGEVEQRVADGDWPPISGQTFRELFLGNVAGDLGAIRTLWDALPACGGWHEGRGGLTQGNDRLHCLLYSICDENCLSS